MKYYKIGEISKLYNISSDILRYYEKVGLLLPEKKEENGYRYYSNKQISKLGTIRALRQLGIGLEEIKVYIRERNLESTRKLINFQIEVVDEKLKELLELKYKLEQKRKYLEEIDQEKEYGKIKIEILPIRSCYKKYKTVVTEWEIDLELKKLKYKADSGEGNHFAESRVGAIVDIDGYREGIYNIFEGTFLIDELGDSELKEGEYITTTFKGDYKESKEYYQAISKYMEKNKLEVNGEILEIYKIDVYETELEEEFITELQIPIKQIKE